MGENENIEITRILDILMRKKFIIIAILIIFMILGCIYSYGYIIPKYKSTTSLLLIPNNTSENKTVTSTDLTLNSELIVTYSNIAKNSKVLSQVINNLKLNMTEEELLKQMQVNVITDTYIIEITVMDTNSQMAMNITKELANVFLEEIKQIYHLDNIGIIDEAVESKVAYNINHAKDVIIFFVIGLVVSGIYIMIIYIFDNTIKKEEEVEKYLKIKSLGAIPIYTNKNQNHAKSFVTECINAVRTNILYMNSGRKAKTILITSCTPREGKSWVSSNIATSFAETNKKVLLIDCDMRKGRAGKIFKVNSKEGLSNYLYFMTGNIEKDVELAKEYVKETKVPNLHILTNGTTPPNPSELIDSDNMKELLEIFKNIYDIIIIDAPPCKLVTDSIILSTIVDSTVLVINSEMTKINDIREVKKSITSVGGELIGAILNKIHVKERTYKSGYYYSNNEFKNNKSQIKEKKLISVEELIEEAKPKLEAKKILDKLPEIPKAERIIESNKNVNAQKTTQNSNGYVDINNNLLEIYELISNQNNRLNQVIDTISSIKSQLNDKEQHDQNQKIEEEINKKMLSM